MMNVAGKEKAIFINDARMKKSNVIDCSLPGSVEKPNNLEKYVRMFNLLHRNLVLDHFESTN